MQSDDEWKEEQLISRWVRDNMGLLHLDMTNMEDATVLIN